jgi:hypothetical protein
MGSESGETDYDQVSFLIPFFFILCANLFLRYAVSNIRELLGHKVDLNFIETNPAVRLEKE